METSTKIRVAIVAVVLVAGLFLLVQGTKITGNFVGTGCSVACSSSEQCDDNNESTVDVCVNKGMCNSSCKNYNVALVPSLG